MTPGVAVGTLLVVDVVVGETYEPPPPPPPQVVLATTAVQSYPYP